MWKVLLGLDNLHPKNRYVSYKFTVSPISDLAEYPGLHPGSGPSPLRIESGKADPDQPFFTMKQALFRLFLFGNLEYGNKKGKTPNPCRTFFLRKLPHSEKV